MQNTKFRKLLISKIAKSKADGFSLIELVIVVAVLAVLAAIAIPAFNNVSKNARSTAAKTTLANIYKECEVSRADSGTASHTAVADANGVDYGGDAVGTTCGSSSTATTTDSCTYTLYNSAVTSGGTTSAAGTKTASGSGCATW